MQQTCRKDPRGRRGLGLSTGATGAVVQALEQRWLLANSSLVFPGADGRLIYAPNAAGDVIPDFSMVGYKTGDVPLPDTPGGVTVLVKQTLSPGAAGVDRTTDIQTAINNVSGMSLDANGFRGAVLLNAGNYPISGTLHITASGVVLMGVGDSSTTGTRLEATGTATRFLIEVDGSGSRATSGSTYTITDSYVPVGARSFHVSSTTSLAVGDSILVNRPSPANWIHDIGMDLLDNPWTAGSKDQNWERTVTVIDTNTKTVTIDIPLTNSLDVQYGGGTFKHYSYSGRISQVGISDMYMYSDSLGAGDLAHATGSVSMDKTLNGWMHNITSDGFAVNQIIIESGSKFCTIDDAVVQNTTVSSQAPPAGISVNGSLNLVENVAQHGVYHAVALTSQVAGPNVIYNMTADGTGSDCGPHQRWSTGGLFDDVTISGNDLQAFNRGNSGTGHGWAGANYVFWNCSARNLEIDNPPTAQNWAIGCIGNKSSNGTFESLGTHVTPTSLYQKQLWDRLHQDPTVQNNASANPAQLTSTTTNLSVLGASDAGEANLKYTWTTLLKPSGAANPSFSATNGTNAGKNLTVTLSQIGTYCFQVTIEDAGGLKTTSNVVVSNQPIVTFAGDSSNDLFRVVQSAGAVNVYRNGVLQSYSGSPVMVIDAGGGTDTISIDYSGGNPVPANGLIVDGGSGSDIVNVTGGSGNDAVTLASGNVTVNGGQFGYVGAEELDLNLGAGTDTLTASGNASVSVQAMNINLTGGGKLAMNAGSTLPDFTDLSVTGATFDLNGVNQTIDAMNGSGTITNTGAACTLTVGQQNGNGTFSGSITNGASALSVTKVGGGKLILSGSNAYTGPTTINAGVIESGNSASLALLSGAVQFGGGTFHVTADTTSANVSNKYTTSFSGATGSNTGTFEIDAGVTLTVGTTGGSACIRTAGGAASGGAFIKTGAGTLRILVANGQQDDPLKLNQGTIVILHPDALGRGDAGVQVDMKSGTTLVYQLDSNSNVQTPINSVDPGGSINVVIDRITPGAAVTDSINALTSSGGAFTVNVNTGANVTNGIAGLTIGTATLGGDGTFNIGANVTTTVTGVVSGAFGVTKTGSGTVFLSGVNSYTGATNVNAGTLQSNGSIASSGGVIVASGASFIAGVTQTLASLTINSGGNASITSGGSKLLTISALSIVGTGKLDLTNNGLAIQYSTTSPLTTVKNWVVGGWSNGAWNGAGINSSQAALSTGPHRTAVGFGEATAVLSGNVFMGQTITLPAVLVRYVLPGDANLDGAINSADFVALASQFGTSNSMWYQGDFSYNGNVNALDFNALATNFGQPIPADPVGSAALAAASSSAPDLFSNETISDFKSQISDFKLEI